MARSVKLSASLICADLFNLQDQLSVIQEGGFDYIHFDMMDGHFVPSIGLGTFFLKQVATKQSLPVETHLMVADPAQFIDEIIDAGTSMVTCHYETGKDMYSIMDALTRRKVKAGIALRPLTPLCHIEPLLEYLDMVLLMAYSPGTSGQRPMENFEERVEDMQKLMQKRGVEHIDIAVDGGVSEEYIVKLAKRGANFFILGSSGLFMKDRTLKEQVMRLQKIVQGLFP